MLLSNIPEEKRAELGFYPTGGCGGNIAWHTEDDVMNVAERGNLERDLPWAQRPTDEHEDDETDAEEGERGARSGLGDGDIVEASDYLVADECGEAGYGPRR